MSKLWRKRGDELTDAERYVRERFPRASCFYANTYWPGARPKKCWLVTLNPHLSVSSGHGDTEIAAWADAANRLEQREKVQVLDSGRQS